MKRFIVVIFLSLLAFVPVTLHAEQSTYQGFSVEASSYEESNERAVNTRVCFDGVKAAGTNLYRNCARIKASVSKKASSFNRQSYSIIFETYNTQLDFKSNSKDGSNYKFWLREQSSNDTPPGFYNFLKKFEEPKQIMVGAMCSKFADDAWLKKNIREALRSTRVSQAVATKVSWDRAFRAWNSIATRCARLASRKVGSAITFREAPKFAACGLTWTGNRYAIADRRAIQTGLKKRKILDGSVDGKFGPKTCEAVKLFLSVEGRPPEKTFDAYEYYLVKKAPSSLAQRKYDAERQKNRVKQSSCSNFKDKQAIKNLQANLKRAGIYRGAVDGIAGPGTTSAIERAERLLGYQVTTANGCIDISEGNWIRVLGTARDKGIYNCPLDVDRQTYNEFGPILKELGYASYFTSAFTEYSKRNFVLSTIKFETDSKNASSGLIRKNCSLSASEKSELIRLSSASKCAAYANQSSVKQLQQVLARNKLYDFVISGNLNSATLEAVKKAEGLLAQRSDMNNGCLSTLEISWLDVLAEARAKGITNCGTYFDRTAYDMFGPLLNDLGYFPGYQKFLSTGTQQDYIRAIMQFETDSKFANDSDVRPNCTLSARERGKLKLMAAQKDCPALSDDRTVRTVQETLGKIGLYSGKVNGQVDEATTAGINRAMRVLGDRASSTENCLNPEELAWLDVLGKARDFGVYRCDFELKRSTFQDAGPKLKDLGYLDRFTNTFSIREQQALIEGIIKFENDQYSAGSDSIKRNCNLSPGEFVELERLWQIKTKAPIDTTPDATKLSDTYTLQMAQNLISDLENYLEEKGFNPFGVKLVPAYAEVSKVSKEGSWTEQDKKSFKALKDLVLRNSEFSLYHSAQVSDRKSQKTRALTRLRAALDNLIADGTLFMQNNPLVESASKVAMEIKDVQKVRDQNELAKLLAAIEKLEQRYETLGVPFREIEIITDDLLLTDEQKALVEKIRLAQERRQTAALEAAALEAENERKAQEAKLKEEELEKARALAETNERQEKIKRYKAEAPILLQDIREYVRAGNQFDISLPKYLQAAKGAEKAKEWSNELFSGYEQLLTYVNKYEAFRQFRSDKEKQRTLQKQKRLADLRNDRSRILKELEEWIKANPFAEEAAILVSLIDDYASKEETQDVGELEKGLSALIEKVRASGVDLPISELLERRGYSLDGATEPLAPTNVITTLSDAQQYIKDVQGFVKQNPTVFGPELVKLYNGIRSVVENNEWNAETKSAFSSFESFTGKQNLFVAFRKAEINKRAEGRKLALERLRSALVQLIADGSLYIQNNQFADNALTIYQTVEFGRSLDRNNNPSDLLVAIDKIKKVYTENEIPFTDTMIEIAFLQMSDEEIKIVEEMNEAYRRRTAEIKDKKDEIEKLNQEITEDKIATELEKTKAKAALAAEEAAAEAEKTAQLVDAIENDKKNFEDNIEQMRLEAQSLVPDTRKFVEEGNRFGLEFILLNAGIAGFEADTWQPPLFDSYMKFRDYVLSNDSFVAFREKAIEEREAAASKAFDDLANELVSMQKSLEEWVLKNQIDAKAASAFGIYQEIAAIDRNPPEAVSTDDVSRLQFDVEAIAAKLEELDLPGVYIYLGDTVPIPSTPLPEEPEEPSPEVPEESITLEAAKTILEDVKSYISTGKGSFDRKKLPLLFAKIRDIENDVWNPKMEQSALEFRDFVLSSDQFFEYHSLQNKKRDQEIQAQKSGASDKIKGLRSVLSEWLAANPFDERAVDVATKLDALEGTLPVYGEGGYDLPLQRLTSILRDLENFSARLDISVPIVENPKPEISTKEPMVLPSEKIVYVNLSGSATHAIRSLDGQIVFEKNQADYCYAMISPLQKMDRFYLRQLLVQKTNAPKFEALVPCSNANIQKMDLIITDGRSINEENLLVKAAIDFGYEAFAEIGQSEIEAEAQRDQIRVENLKDDLAQGVRTGFGYVLNDNQSSLGCLTISDNEEAHLQLISDAEDRINLYRDKRLVSFEPMPINQAFSQWQRGRCGMIYSNADDLGRLIASLESNGDQFNLSPDWFSPKTVAKIQNAIKTRDEQSKKDLEERRRQLALQKQLEDDAKQRAISEAEKAQLELRKTHEPRVKSLKENFIAEMDLVLDELFEKNTSNQKPEYRGKFLAFDNEISYHERMRWEETEREMKVVDYGTAEWVGRSVEALIVRANVKIRNRTLGEYKDICFDLGHIWDREFEMVRDPVAVPCSDTATTNWEINQTFKSLWNVQAP